MATTPVKTALSGPDAGDVISLTANISATGTVTSVDAEGENFPGVVDLRTGRISLGRGIAPIQLIKGSNSSVMGNGTFFNPVNGNRGRITITKTGGLTSPLSSRIVGTWKTTSIATATGSNQACLTTLTIGSPPEACGSNDRAVFSSNGTITFTPTSSTPETGTWFVGGNTLTVKSGTQTTTYNVSILTNSTGSTMRLAELTYSDTADPSASSDGVVTNLIKQ